MSIRDKQRRDDILRVRMTTDERAHLRALATAAGLTESGLVRQLLRNMALLRFAARLRPELFTERGDPNVDAWEAGAK